MIPDQDGTTVKLILKCGGKSQIGRLTFQQVLMMTAHSPQTVTTIPQMNPKVQSQSVNIPITGTHQARGKSMQTQLRSRTKSSHHR